MMLVASAIFALVAYRLARIRQLETLMRDDGERLRRRDRRRGPQRPRRRLLPGDAPACGRWSCERREIVGGCCVTEEFAPGFRASTGAYVLSMLREPVWRDLRLAERGIEVDAGRARRSTCSPDGARLLLDDDIPADAGRVPAASRPPTRAALPEFEDDARPSSRS